MFGTEHLLWLAVCAAVIVAGSVLAVKKQLSLKTALTILCVICVVSEVVKLFCVLIAEERVNKYGVFIKESDLPFHLCSMQLFFAFIARFTKNKKLQDFLLTFMIPTCSLGALAALLIPTIGCSFTNVRTYQYFLYHAGLIWFAVTAICRFKIKLDFKAYLKTIVALLALVMLCFYVNGFTQCTNFMYVSAPPLEGLPILNMDNGWFVYFLSYMALALAVITLFFLPFWIHYAVKRKKNPEENSLPDAD